MVMLLLISEFGRRRLLGPVKMPPFWCCSIGVVLWGAPGRGALMAMRGSPMLQQLEKNFAELVGNCLDDDRNR